MQRSIVTLSLLFAVFGCQPSLAQERYPAGSPMMPHITYEPADPYLWDDGEVGFFYFHNRLTFGHELITTVVVETEVGQVIMEINSTPNDQCPQLDCPDTLTAIDWPTGYAVHPMSISVDERAMGFITLFETYGS